MLSKAPLGKAMQTFTRLLYTQSDWGALATVNVKSYASFEQIHKQYSDAPVPGAGITADLPLQAAFKEPNKIATQGEPFPVQIVVVGGKAVESVTLYHRTLGEGQFIALPMMRGFENVYRAMIPGPSVTEKGLEYYIEAGDGSKKLMRVPKGTPSVAVTVMKLE